MKKTLLIFVILFLFSLSYRLGRIHVPFWVDEFSSANQSLLLLKYGAHFFAQPEYYAEPRSILTTASIAICFKLFGQSEESARLPIAVAGSLIPFLLFYLSQILLPKKNAVAWGSALFGMSSYFLITWSRQARGYALQECFLLTALIGYFLFLNSKQSRRKMIGGLVSILSLILGIFTHPLFFIAVTAIAIHLALMYRSTIMEVFHQKTIISAIVLAVILMSGVVTYTGLLSQVLDYGAFVLKHGLYNNVWYYHSFLWREYGLITFLGYIGLLIVTTTQHKKMFLIWELMVGYLVFVCFLFPSIDSRYLLPIFPFLLFGMAVSIEYLMAALIANFKLLGQRHWIRGVLTVGCVIAVIANGHKFDLKPSSFYSVNHDFREIALVDYDQVYGVIKHKGALSEGKTAVIDTWPDRLEWYLGSEFQPNYVFRWEDQGYMKQTPNILQQNGDKVLKGRSQTKLIATVADLQKVLSVYPKGFIWIDDTSLPADVIDFAKNHFKQELYLEHYPLDDNPYSIWPGTLYSWGI